MTVVYLENQNQRIQWSDAGPKCSSCPYASSHHACHQLKEGYFYIVIHHVSLIERCSFLCWTLV